jgi:hypothetical protein
MRKYIFYLIIRHYYSYLCITLISLENTGPCESCAIIRTNLSQGGRYFTHIHTCAHTHTHTQLVSIQFLNQNSVILIKCLVSRKLYTVLKSISPSI